jgi:uncharacterized protein YidB (DUF937 family)
MNILDTMKSALGGGSGQQQNDLMSTVMNLIGGQGAGLQGLISQFSSKGLGDIVNSWVSTGNNLPVSPEQLKGVLGSDTMNTLASKTGMDVNTLTAKLSEMLPQVVDKLTPDGKVPDGDLMTKGMSMLGGMFGKK